MNGTEFAEHRIDAFGRGALDELVNDYTPTSVIITPMGNMVGAEQARGMISGFVTEFGMPGTTFEVLSKSGTDRVAHFTWKAETPKTSYRFGSEVYFLDEDGKVIAHVFSGEMSPK